MCFAESEDDDDLGTNPDPDARSMLEYTSDDGTDSSYRDSEIYSTESDDDDEPVISHSLPVFIINNNNCIKNVS